MLGQEPPFSPLVPPSSAAEVLLATATEVLLKALTSDLGSDVAPSSVICKVPCFPPIAEVRYPHLEWVLQALKCARSDSASQHEAEQ